MAVVPFSVLVSGGNDGKQRSGARLLGLVDPSSERGNEEEMERGGNRWMAEERKTARERETVVATLAMRFFPNGGLSMQSTSVGMAPDGMVTTYPFKPHLDNKTST